MALKVGGTSVVDNTRALENVASVDATTAAAITAAGVGGGGTYDFVASGAISSGDVVVLNANGTVSVVVGSAQAVGSPTVFESASTEWVSTAYDANAQKVIVAYQDEGNSGYGTAIVGTVSGTSISFGSPVVFHTSNSRFTSVVYDSTSQKVVIAFYDAGNLNYGTAVVGTVSGTSISFGSPVVFESAATDWVSATYDANAQKVVIAYRDDGNSNYGTAIVGTVSGTSISFGTPVVFESANTQYISATYNSAEGRVVIAYRDVGNTNDGTAIVGTVSGTSISFGSPVVFDSSAVTFISSTYDPDSQKTIIAYVDDLTKDGVAVVGTVSGTSISFGTRVEFVGNEASETSTTYDANAKKVVVAYRDNGNSLYGTIVSGSVSGTTISFETSVVFESARSDRISAVYDASTQKVVVAFVDKGNLSYGTAVVFQNASTNASDWLGISTEAISDTSTGAVTIRCGINDQQLGLTTASTYYVADDGSLTTTDTGRKIGKALAADKLLITEANS